MGIQMKKILLISCSPRKGNSETIIYKMQEFLKTKGANTEVCLLRKKKIERCNGCIEYCNKNLTCYKKDDVPKLLEKMKTADAFVFVSPNYFRMPPGIFKDFIDRCCVLYTAQIDFSKKKSCVIVVGEEKIKYSDICTNNIAKNFCEILGMKVVAKKSFQSKSELKGNYNDIFENRFNKNILKDLRNICKAIM